MNDIELLKQNHRANDIIFKGLVEFGCFKAALELDLFTQLGNGAKDTATLAAATGSVPPRLGMLLEALRQMGVTIEDNGSWSLTSFAKAMFVPNADQPNLYMIPVAKAMAHLSDAFYFKLADAVKGQLDFKGEVPYPPVTREDNLYFEEIHRSNAHFAIKLLLEEADLSGAKTLVDVGGGIGDISAALLKKFTQLSSTILNLPGAIELVNENAAEKGVGDRLKGTAVDIYRDSYPKADAVMFCRILYSANEQLTDIMCRKAYDALPAGGKVLILDMIIDDPENPNFDYLSHYILGAGMPFSVLGFKPQDAYKEILEKIGFSDVRIVRQYDHLLCEALKPA
ncbi:MAG: C-20 methyltransferase BchU [Chlorobium sp.]|uniref:bacteriochlorophyllide d C-20 methyltransferase BchU n=1 Tax=Chlorobium sp. TaxID=1095 RepID=UPI0025C6095E|nr:C-20 methyltransferase BchU [Chlorobium sp.]MCF8217107.1 C-20 methyltransferase BchU [Chlorobium sp.]MCF8271953.1 C-20 methyltransferase BchU [Chlorobium sp.]MCF8288324.1 C-20 methyltransferase BchU [Chlorobium sp.]MCF8291931.1 C-20 methyltransferase BchU [Chlorobium sp.]MCF8386038.1 C-20 methyltransferase BchU [Chlorobium sp.]